MDVGMADVATVVINWSRTCSCGFASTISPRKTVLSIKSNVYIQKSFETSNFSRNIE